LRLYGHIKRKRRNRQALTYGCAHCISIPTVSREVLMCNSCDVHIDGVWTHLAVGQPYETPDDDAHVPFTVSSMAADAIEISSQGIRVTRDAFSDALHYLRANRHDEDHPCAIGSNNDSGLAGPLCREARSRNANVRCINYILPILADLGIVGIGSARPNTTWVIRCS
jgi:hypothetical protein